VAQQPNLGPSPLFFVDCRSHIIRNTPGRTPRTRDQFLAEFAIYTTNTRDEQSCFQRDSNLRAQQFSGRRPTLSIVRPQRSAPIRVIGLVYTITHLPGLPERDTVLIGSHIILIYHPDISDVTRHTKSAMCRICCVYS
jgi:hypothetical protein